MKIAEINISLREQLLNNNQILSESCRGLTADQQQIVEGVYKTFLPVIEATLTPDQIRSLFGNVEAELTASGKNRSAIGKGIDAAKTGIDYAKKVNDAINQFGKWLQDTTPVQQADQKFDQLKTKVADKFPNLTASLGTLGNWMKENPGKSAAVIGLLTVLASLGAGPAGGAVAGQILRGAAELIKGEKLSTAVGKGIKVAVLGYLSGKAFELIGDWLKGFRASSIPIGPQDAGLERVSYGATYRLQGPGYSYTDTIQGFNITVLPGEKSLIDDAMRRIGNRSFMAFDDLKALATKINTPEYRQQIRDVWRTAREQQLNNDSLYQWINAVAKAGQSLSQGTAAAANDIKKAKESMQLSDQQIRSIIECVVKINEGSWLSSLTGAIGKGIDKLSTKVTADSLFKDWQKSGGSKDSDDIKRFLIAKGVDKKVIDKIWVAAGIN